MKWENKVELRKKALQDRACLSQVYIEDKSKSIRESIMKEICLSSNVLTYISYRNEVKTFQLVENLCEKNIMVSVPVIAGEKIKPARIQDLSNLKENEIGIPEPQNPSFVKKSIIDTVIVPGVVFDRSGNRIGYGKGYYDRFLDGFEGKSIGVVYDRFLKKSIPTNTWDISVDKIVTEEDVLDID